MIVAAPTSRRGRRVNLTPLVDVIFLLVIFFLTSSTFLTTGKLKLTDQARPPHEAGDAAPSSLDGAGATAANRVLVAPIDAERVRINGIDHRYDGLIAALDAFAAKGAASVIVAPAASASLQDLATTIELARLSQIPAVSIRVD